jgi:hypothetical protein
LIKGQSIKVDYFRLPKDRTELTRKLPPGFLSAEPPASGSLPSREILLEPFSPFGEIQEVFTIHSYAIVGFAKHESVISGPSFQDARVVLLPELRWSVRQGD